MVWANQHWTRPKKKPRSKKDIREFLEGHPRYNTMNSWNDSTSYARCIKVTHVEFPDKETESIAFDVVGADSDWWEASGIRQTIWEFDCSYGHRWQIGTNGRSGGYLVLYQGGFQEPGKCYKRYCISCGQGNYKKDADVCGRCGEEGLIDYPFVQRMCWPGRGTDHREDFEDWDFDALRDRLNLVWDFDDTVDCCIKRFIDFCTEHKVEEQEIMVPTTKRVVVAR